MARNSPAGISVPGPQTGLDTGLNGKIQKENDSGIDFALTETSNGVTAGVHSGPLPQ
jgi:hypothetical protein